MNRAAVFAPRSGIRRVPSFHDLVTAEFADGVNALCWERALTGDFRELAELLAPGSGVTILDEERLRALPASPAVRAAIDVMLEDQRRLRELGFDAELNAVLDYARDESGPIPTDVCSFHVDSAPEPASTWLCTYHGAPTEGLPNNEARRLIDIPSVRAELLRVHGSADDDAFREFLRAKCYDLHYEPVPGARPFSFGVGHLWRVAVKSPGSPVPPCIHRAPATGPRETRLLLIG
jgi:hypothetical protein